MKFLFWFSLFMIFYAYFGYAIVLMTIDAHRRIFHIPKKANTQAAPTGTSTEASPFVSFIITAYNEEQRIAQKIENSLAQTYPPERLEIIIASDCSTDQTDTITLSYAVKGIKLVRAPERKGKENAQMHAVCTAVGDILVFSDVATILEPDAIRQIVSNFSDPSIGCVSSEDRFIDRDGSVSGEGLYVRYEMFIRKLESRVNTLVGLSGSFFAARKEVCRNWASDLQSDFNTLLNAIRLGMRGVSDPSSIGYYQNILDERKEFQRKVRTILRGITVMMRSRHLLNPCRYGLFAFQLLSHKICRWLVPLFLIAAFLANISLLDDGPIYVFLFLTQSAFYTAAVFHAVQNGKPDAKAYGHENRMRLALAQSARIAFYFVSVNVSILMAWAKYFFGERSTLWEPSKR